jgi:hypothetical protein
MRTATPIAVLIVIIGFIVFAGRGGAAASHAARPDPPPRFASIWTGLSAATTALKLAHKSEVADSAHPSADGYCYDLANNVYYDLQNNVGQELAAVTHDRNELVKYIAAVRQAVAQLTADVDMIANDGAPTAGEAAMIRDARLSIAFARQRANAYIAAANRAAQRAWLTADRMDSRYRCAKDDVPADPAAVPAIPAA